MIRLSWLQLRAQAVAVFGVLAAVAVALAVTGPHLVHLYDTNVATCNARGDCPTATTAFLDNYRLLQQLGTVLLGLPALVGIFWGAPLVARELETGTFRLAWTQSITRTRWLTVKLGLVGLASVVVAGSLSLMVTWWSSPLDRVTMNPFSPSQFDRRDLVPIGYAAFAFALGVTAGIIIRRTLPAMAATLVAFVGLRLAFVEWVRYRLLAPLQTISALRLPTANGYGRLSIGITPPNPEDWVLSDNTVNAAGQVIGHSGVIGANGLGISFHPSGHGRVSLQGAGPCPNRFPTSSGGGGSGIPSPTFDKAAQQCVDKLGLKNVLTYQPVSRYWAFQWYETAIFVVLALMLGGFCFWWVRRRLS